MKISHKKLAELKYKADCLLDFEQEKFKWENLEQLSINELVSVLDKLEDKGHYDKFKCVPKRNISAILESTDKWLRV